ncbi:MAG: gliding motility-associated C-terminal domain-containing protein [Bacteroidia bacterium]|nr:gliding motility-associated C-terminal domain-containing protein [Bacteroidia bacterium]
MRLKSKTYIFNLLFSFVGGVIAPLGALAQVKHYNSVCNLKDYNYTNSLSFYNFNKKLITTYTYKIDTLESKMPNYSQFCDSFGTPILTRVENTYYDKMAKRIPIYFSPKENEIMYSGFLTNKSKFVYALLAKFYRPMVEYIHPGSINIIKFNQNSEVLDTIIIKDDMYNWGQLYIEYSPTCNFNYILTSDIIDKKFRIKAYKVDSAFNRNPAIIYTSEYVNFITAISPKGNIIALCDRKESDRIKKQYSKFYHFNSQKLKIGASNPFFCLQTENNSFCFSADGQFLFNISHDSVIQYSFRYLQWDSILKSKKLIGILEKGSLGYNHFTQFALFPDENFYIRTYYGKDYTLIKESDTVYKLSLSKLFPSFGEFRSITNTALYHPHFRIETKDTVCINETLTLKTNHIDSFATYHWVVKDETGRVMLNSYAISPDFKPSIAGRYFVQLIYRWRCNSMDSALKVIYVAPPLQIEKIKDSLLCYNEIYEIIIDAKFKNVNWSNGAKGNKLNVSNQGFYSVSYTDGCQIYNDTFTVSVINELKSQVNYPHVVLCNENEAFSTAFTLPAYSSYKWSDGHRSLNRVISIPGNYEVKFYNKCQSMGEMFEVLYSEKKTELFIPNAITPNGDQINENWEINDPSNIKEIEWIIFNRWGEKIDQGKNTSFQLNKIININTQTQGIYYYQFIITFQCNSIRKTYNGIFQIVN